MRFIDMQSWPRRKHFDLFRGMAYPYMNISANVEITSFYPRVKQYGVSFTVAIMYLLTRVANGIPEFRYRIRGESVVEHEVVHPSTTMLVENDLFSFCTVPYRESFVHFAALAAQSIARIKETPTLEDEPGQDNLLYMSSMPWVSFTGVMHPVPLNPPDSVPRIVWGKFFPENRALKMPLGVQGHHALMDGVHLGRYFAQVQELLDQPDGLFDHLEQG